MKKDRNLGTTVFVGEDAPVRDALFIERIKHARSNMNREIFHQFLNENLNYIPHDDGFKTYKNQPDQEVVKKVNYPSTSYKSLLK